MKTADVCGFQVCPLVCPFGYLAKIAKNRKAVKSYETKQKRAETLTFPLSKVGADNQIRTGDLILTNDILTIFAVL